MFENDLEKLNGNTAIGKELTDDACAKGAHFCEMSGSGVGPAELIAHLINQGANFVEGLQLA